MTNRLWWLPAPHDFRADLNVAKSSENPGAMLARLARTNLDTAQLLSLDRQVRLLMQEQVPGLHHLKLALLGSSTLEHLLPALRVAGLRHDFLVDVRLGGYGQYMYDVHDPASQFHSFSPDILLLALDTRHLLGEDMVADGSVSLESIVSRLTGLWRAAQENWGAQVIQQAVLPCLPSFMGGNEHRLPNSPSELTFELNRLLRAACAVHEVDFLGLDRQVVHDGLAAWHDPVLWLRAKQEVTPLAGNHYADLLMRLIGARRGRSGKCLVLDLDNTLWGGVIGDDGLAGIVLGQGDTQGEAFVSFQRYVRALAERGVILAVCSKNDEANALEPFERHPEMVLRREHIACFIANWEDKATNLRRIASELNIGLDSLVFVDDNPFERNIVRRELPMVRVPELPGDPALYFRCIEQSGYFEAITVTVEDLARTRLYQARRASETARRGATDIDGYLRSLNMVMEWRRFDQVGRQRITQLVNKTNQFNLTTRRYTDAEIGAVIDDPAAIGIQVRLRDNFSDHGIIAVLIGRYFDRLVLEIETWLMSCRVLGRQVEHACFQVLAAQAAANGASTIMGRYIPSPKNSMVKDFYPSLGFELVSGGDDRTTEWRFDLSEYQPQQTYIQIVKG